MKTAEFCQFTQRASLYIHFTESPFLISKNMSKYNCDIQCFSYTVLFKMCHNIVSCVSCKYFSSLWGLLVNVPSLLFVQRSVLLQRHPVITFIGNMPSEYQPKKITEDPFLLVSRIFCL
jgi:hypothetical protein